MRKTIIATCALLVGVHTSQATVTPEGWWHFGEVGDFYADSSGNGHRFSAAFSSCGGGGLSGQAAVAVVPFGVGGPLGTTGYVSTNSLFWTPNQCTAAGMWAPGFNPPSTNYGIEVWVLPQDTGVRGGNATWIFSSGSSAFTDPVVPAGAPGGVYFLLTYDPDLGTSSISANIVGSNAAIGDSVPADTNTWTHLAIVNENGTQTFYVNGVAHGAPSVGNSTVPNGHIFAGSSPGTTPTFDGYLDELRIFTFEPGKFSTSDLLLRPPGPNIVQQPETAGVWDGGAAVFDVTAAIDSSLTYQWQRGGANVSGATTPELYLPTVTPADSGSVFDVVLKNTSGTVISSNATMTVLPVQTGNVAFYQSAVRGESGLAAYFTVDGDTGTKLSNIVDAAHNGTLEGNAAFDGRTNRAFGVRALRLKGDGDVQVPNNAAYEFGNGTGTIEALVYLDRSASTVNQTIVSMAVDPAAAYYIIQTSADGTALIYNNIALTQPITWSVPVKLLGRLAHLAIVFTNQTVTAYVDGQSLGTKANPSFGGNTGMPLYIGSASLSSPGVWTGTIDELAIYTTALSPNAVAIHNSRFIYGTNVTAPTIVSQPTGSKTLLAGGSPTFDVVASGTAPLGYQWNFNGAPIKNATASTLTLSQTTVQSSGKYSVTVSNPIGSTNSVDFNLTFVAPTDPYATMIMNDNPSAYWRLDETNGPTAFDSAGGHDGTYTGSLTFGAPGALPGIADAAVNFAGGNAEVPYSAALNPSGAFTIEFWARPIDQSTYTPLCSQFRNGSGRSGWCFYDFNDANSWEIHLGDPSGVNLYAYGAGPVPGPGDWNHVAAVYDGATTVTLYSEGEVVGSNTQVANGGSFVPNPSAPLEIGVRNGGALAFNGDIDEVAIYGYALSYNQISNHWHIKFQPSGIVQQPTALTNVEGNTVTLSAAVSGFPNTFQWYKDNTPLSESNNADGTPHYPQSVTNATLVIVQTLPSDSGRYHLVVTNPGGNSTTTDATLSIAADKNPPLVTDITGLGTPNPSGSTPYLVKVTFDKRIEATGAQNPANFTINGGVKVNGATISQEPLAASIGGDWRAVLLATSGLTPGQTYTLTVTGIKDQTVTGNLITPATLSFTAPVLTQGGLVWDYYYLGSTSDISSLLDSPLYPSTPTTNAFLNVFDTDPITGGDLNNMPGFSGLGDNYGDSVSGWITPTASGQYTFFLASDDPSQLLLSPDSDPAKAALIAEETGCCHGFTEPPAAYTSDPQPLVAGQKYFIKAVHVEKTGGDYVKVAWRMAGDTNAASSLSPIPAQFLSAYAAPPAPKFTLVTFSGGQLTITWTGTGTLQESADLKTWSAVTGTPASPFQTAPSGSYKFYRLKQ